MLYAEFYLPIIIRGYRIPHVCRRMLAPTTCTTRPLCQPPQNLILFSLPALGSYLDTMQSRIQEALEYIAVFPEVLVARVARECNVH